jgi:hypothetical protein
MASYQRRAKSVSMQQDGWWDYEPPSKFVPPAELGYIHIGRAKKVGDTCCMAPIWVGPTLFNILSVRHIVVTLDYKKGSLPVRK